jgi:hypothetical protein
MSNGLRSQLMLDCSTVCLTARRYLVSVTTPATQVGSVPPCHSWPRTPNLDRSKSYDHECWRLVLMRAGSVAHQRSILRSA